MGVWDVLQNRVGERAFLFRRLRNLVAHLRPPRTRKEAVMGLSHSGVDDSKMLLALEMVLDLSGTRLDLPLQTWMRGVDSNNARS